MESNEENIVKSVIKDMEDAYKVAEFIKALDEIEIKINCCVVLESSEFTKEEKTRFFYQKGIVIKTFEEPTDIQNGDCILYSEHEYQSSIRGLDSHYKYSIVHIDKIWGKA